MSSLVVDTHSAIWYLEKHASLSQPARDAINTAISAGRNVCVSSVSLIEITYLVEKSKLQQVQYDVLVETLVSVMEVLYGFQLNAAANKRFSASFKALCGACQIISFDDAVAGVIAQVRASLKKNGTPIGSFDLLIGATALTHGCILVSANVREFAKIEGLVVENWR